MKRGLWTGTDSWPADCVGAGNPKLRASASSADVPVLIAYGAKDTIVLVEKSRRLAAALQAARVPVELQRLPGAYHEQLQA